MEIDIIAQLHVEQENKWKIWKIKNTYIGQGYMAKKYRVPLWRQMTPFIVDIFDDAVYICFVDNRTGGGPHYIEKIEFTKSNRKKILEYLRTIEIGNPTYVTIHTFKGLPSAGSPKD